MTMLEELKTLGVNTEEGIARLNGNASFYERMLGKFLTMMKASSVRPDFDGTDYADVIEATHAIKGVAGNLSITPVYEAYSEIVRLLREAKPEEARAVLEKIIPVQTEIMNCIEKYQ